MQCNTSIVFTQEGYTLYHFRGIWRSLVLQLLHDTWILRNQLTKPQYLGLVLCVDNMESSHSPYQCVLTIDRAELVIMDHVIKSSFD